MSNLNEMIEAPTLKPRKGVEATDEQAPRAVPVLTIIAHPDLSRIGERAVLRPLLQGRAAAVSRKHMDFAQPGNLIGQPLRDPFLSRKPIFLKATDRGGIVLDPAENATEVRVNDGVLGEPRIFSREALKKGVAIVLAQRLVLWLHLSNHETRSDADDLDLIGFSDAIIELRLEIKRVADLKTPVLLRGASGTGKELVAQAIHRSGGPGRKMISVNMGSIPPSLAASELFGAAKGSYTGSERNQVGFFRSAHGGTLFLDEVGETPAEVQVLLLRTIETGEVIPLGSQNPIKLDVRLIAATDADLEKLMSEDSFRIPLFHRLSGYVIHLPPLTQRLEDLGRLFMHFARAEMAAVGEADRLVFCDSNADPWLPTSIVSRLLAFSWPGNVRQLRNIVRQLVIGSRGSPTLMLTGGVKNVLDGGAISGQHPEKRGSARKSSLISEQELIFRLRANQWDIKATAEDLGIARGTLYALIEKTPGLRKAGDLEAEEIRACLKRHDGDYGAAAEDLMVSRHALKRRMYELEL